MIKQNDKETIESLTREIDPDIRNLFFSHLGPDYFSLYTPDEIARHIKLTAEVTGEHLVRCQIKPIEKKLLNIVIAGYDYFSEFSLLCGLLTSYGLDIESGHIFTFEESSLNQDCKRIIDHFQVTGADRTSFNQEARIRFKADLDTVVKYLENNQLDRAREKVNLQVVEFLSGIEFPMDGKTFPTKITFNNKLSAESTLMEIESRNSPGFLYAFSNAISLQNINIDKVTIESSGQTVHDRIFLRYAQGGQIKGGKTQNQLKIAILFTKQFTYFLAAAPDPVKGIQYFDRLLGKIMEKGLSPSAITFLNGERNLDLLARLLGTSEYLFEDFLKMHFDELLPILKKYRAEKLRPGKIRLKQALRKTIRVTNRYEGKKERLNQFKDRELFRIDLVHLLSRKRNLVTFSRALSDLAEIVLESAYKIGFDDLQHRFGMPRLENGKPCPFAICGLGKFGGGEMGFGSDIELLLVYGGDGETDGKDPMTNQEFYERLGQSILNLIEAKREGIFHVDLRLRPYGSKGSLTNSLDFLERYYQLGGDAAPFERQALTKLCWVTGNESLGRKIENIRDRFTYSGAPWNLKTALNLRQRQTKELVQPRTVNVKFSSGGVVDLEYAVQYFQILKGRTYPVIRTPTTLIAIERLSQVGLISRKEREELIESYLFLRNLIDALRVVRGNARDLILPERSSNEFKFLARRMGYFRPDWENGAIEMDRDIRRNMKWAHQFYTGHFSKKR